MCAVLFMDSPGKFYNAAQAGRIYNNSGFGQASPGRWSTYCGEGSATWLLDAELGTIVAGFAQVPVYNTGMFEAGNDLAGGPSFWGVSVGTIADGRIYIDATLGGGTIQVVGSGSTALKNTQWQYIECKFSASGVFTPPSGGDPFGSFLVNIDYEIRVNENTVMSGLMSTPSVVASAPIPHCNFQDLTFTGFRVDDLIVDSANFNGDLMIAPLYPNADIATGWTASGGSVPHYTMVNDHPQADDNTTYVASDTVGQVDSYTFTTLIPFIGDIVGVQIMGCLTKTDVGAGSVKGIYNGTVSTPLFYPNFGGYEYLISTTTVNPTTSLPWTQADLVTFEFAFERMS